MVYVHRVLAYQVLITSATITKGKYQEGLIFKCDSFSLAAHMLSRQECKYELVAWNKDAECNGINMPSKMNRHRCSGVGGAGVAGALPPNT